MSHSHILYCSCWDPWKTGGKRLVKTKAGPLNQKSKKGIVRMIPKDQSKSQLNLPGTPRVRFFAKTYGHPLRSREPRDISKEFEEEIVPGFTLSGSKEYIDVTLGEKFFEKQKPAEEPIKPTLPQPIYLKSLPKLETEDVVADLVDQISELTAIIEQLRRDHQVTHKQMEQDMEEKCNEIQEEHDNKMRGIQTFHIAEVNALEERYKKELRNERAAAQEKLTAMQKEYKYLKNAFRVYQDSISDEMEEKWLRRQAEWKKSERTEREKALLQQKQSLTKRFEMELEEQKKIIQKNSFLIGKAYEEEKEELQQQYQTALENIEELNDKFKILQTELSEKNETLNAIASTLYNTEMELKKEPPYVAASLITEHHFCNLLVYHFAYRRRKMQEKKANVADMEKSLQQKIVAIKEQHRITLNTLTEENVMLRRKLIQKNEELFNAQKSSIFGMFD